MCTSHLSRRSKTLDSDKIFKWTVVVVVEYTKIFTVKQCHLKRMMNDSIFFCFTLRLCLCVFMYFFLSSVTFAVCFWYFLCFNLTLGDSRHSMYRYKKCNWKLDCINVSWQRYFGNVRHTKHFFEDYRVCFKWCWKRKKKKNHNCCRWYVAAICRFLVIFFFKVYRPHSYRQFALVFYFSHSSDTQRRLCILPIINLVLDRKTNGHHCMICFVVVVERWW